MYSIVHPYGHDDQNMHAYMRWEFEALQKVLIPMNILCVFDRYSLKYMGCWGQRAIRNIRCCEVFLVVLLHNFIVDSLDQLLALVCLRHWGLKNEVDQTLFHKFESIHGLDDISCLWTLIKTIIQLIWSSFLFLFQFIFKTSVCWIWNNLKPFWF